MRGVVNNEGKAAVKSKGLLVTEIFGSVQGEGRRAGRLSVFVRLAGCNRRCRWCDTKYAWDESKARPMSVAEIIARLERYPGWEVVVTGGEPLLAQELPALLEALGRTGRFVTVETNGTRYRRIRCDLLSISPKPAEASAEGRSGQGDLNLRAIRRFIKEHEYQLKFVVEKRGDLEAVEKILARLKGVDADKVMLMPQARSRSRYRREAPRVARWCLEKGWHFSPRLQVELWGGKRGK